MTYRTELVCETKGDPSGLPFLDDTLALRASQNAILVTVVDAGETESRNTVYRLFWSHA